MNVLSLFDGMSCGRLALERLGIKVDNYFASEIDKYAIKVTMNNFPDTIQLGDVTKVKGSDLPKIDLLIGGSPCQGFSFSGKGLNFNDPRSALFFEFVRLLKEVNPKYFLLENVVMKKEWQDIISQHLGVEPIMINSRLVSAQNRKRLYWTNIPNVTQPEDLNIKIKDINEDPNKTNCLTTVQKDNVLLKWSDVMEHNAENVYYVTQKMMDWIQKSPDRAKKFKIYTSDCAEKMQMLEASHHKGISNQRCFAIKDVKGLRYISPVECERLQTVPVGYTACVSNTQRYKMLGNGWTVSVICHILKNMS